MPRGPYIAWIAPQAAKKQQGTAKNVGGKYFRIPTWYVTGGGPPCDPVTKSYSVGGEPSVTCDQPEWSEWYSTLRRNRNTPDTVVHGEITATTHSS